MKGYAAKMSYLLRRQGGYCAIASELGMEFARPTQLHHRCHNTKRARNKYPLFIDSLMNLVAVNHDQHLMHPSALKIRDNEAESRERFLERHPAIARAVNLEVPDHVLTEFFDFDSPFGAPGHPHTDGSRDYPRYLLGGRVSRKSQVAQKPETPLTGGHVRRVTDKGRGDNPST